MRTTALLTTAALLAIPAFALGASPLDSPYEARLGKPSCGNELKLVSVKDAGGDKFQTIDVLLHGDKIKSTPLPPTDFRAGFTFSPEVVRTDDLGYLLAAFDCKYSSGLKVTELKLGIKFVDIKGVPHWGSRISMDKTTAAAKPAGTACLPNEDGKFYHYRAFWGMKDDGSPVVVFKRPDGNPACFTRS